MDAYEIALVSLAGSIIAAIFAWTQAVRTAKLTTSSAETIERLKLDADRTRRALEAAITEARPLETALDELWSDLQIFKDSAATVLDGADDRAIQAEVLRASLERVSVNYRAWAPRISDDAKLVWHGSRNTCALVLQIIARDEPIDAAGRETLRDLRQALSDRQALITRERQELRSALTDTFAELL